MGRIKFLVFALIVLAFWLIHLAVLGPKIGAAAVQQAELQAAAAPVSVSRLVLERRVAVQQALLRAAATPAAATALRAGGKPDVDRLTALRTAVGEGLPEELRKVLIVGLVSDDAALYARGESEPQSTTTPLDLPSIAKAGGASLHVFSTLHQFLVYTVAGADAKRLTALVVGAPTVPSRVADAVASELKLEGVAVGTKEKIYSAGAHAKTAEQALTKNKAGQAVPVTGATSRLPMLTQGDWLGGGAVIAVSLRSAVPGTPLEVAAVAGTGGVNSALADDQQTALLLFGLLFVLSAVWTVMAKSPQTAVDEAEPLPGPALARRAEPAFSPAYAPPPPAPVEASPDDFHFGSATGRKETPAAPMAAVSEAPAEENGSQGLEELAPLPDETTDHGDNEQTMAYPSQAAGALESAPPQDEDYAPEQTRVAAIPHELLQASLRGEPTGELALNDEGAADPEQVHYEDVFRDFVATREQCGESADGLTFDKFSQKLRKNRDQLIEKHACRTVRFHVYVKEGRAALKATPVKD